MKVCMISCWYRKDMYSHNCNNLLEGYKKDTDVSVKFVTSNCNCFTSAQKYGIARHELLNEECDIVKIPYAPLEPSKAYGKFKYYLVKWSRINYFFETLRGVVFYWKSRGCDLIHFDQVLRSFGVLSFATLLMLARMSKKKVVVTVHEFDPLQIRYPFLNNLYEKADRILVFSRDFKKELEGVGIREDKIAVIHYGSALTAMNGSKREQFVFFGGHKLLKGKGYDTLLDAIDLLKQQGRNPIVHIYVGEGCIGLEEGKQKAEEMGLSRQIVWSEFLFGQELADQYQRSVACLIPYTGGSGRHPATTAMANATPVICTRKAALPEYLGDDGIYIEENSPVALAGAMSELLGKPEKVTRLGERLRNRAEQLFASDLIAQQTLDEYHRLVISDEERR